MIWLYWRRTRLAVGAFGLALGTLATLTLVASALGDGRRPGPAPSAALRGPNTSTSRSMLPSAQDAAVRRGLLLMAAAVNACRTLPYSGVQIVAWSSPEGSSSYLLDVWHRPGQPALVQDNDNFDQQIGTSKLPGTIAGGTVGVLSISAGMLDLLRANYVLEYAGLGSSSARPAQIVSVWRHDGTLAARYWLDEATGLPLRRETFDRSGRRVSEGAFIDLRIGNQEISDMPSEAGRAWSEYVPPIGQATASQPTAARLAALRADGWPVPGRLAGNMILAGVSMTETPSGTVLDARYSDGLSVVSVFMQHGVLPRTLAGWHDKEVSGTKVLATESGDLVEQGLAWSAHGIVYTVIADAPPAAVASIVAQLPHDTHTGFWSRVARGLKRMASWFDPFS
jgi:sigma-E factor negative regulatory protein RseB